MSVLQVNFYAKSLKRMTAMNVILPVGRMEKEDVMPPFKTLYLLHGFTANYMDWLLNSDIFRWAEEYGLAVVMPSGDNAFYIDQKGPNQNYGKFIGEELVETSRHMFPLSCRKEDTFLAGLSMGGYGALRNGLKYFDTFGYIASLSGGMHIFEGIDCVTPYDGDYSLEALEEAAFTDANPRVIIKELKEKQESDKIPHSYMACGTEDFLIEVNHSFRDFLLENGVDVTYEEGSGAHDWLFWNPYLKKILEWLPLK